MSAAWPNHFLVSTHGGKTCLMSYNFGTNKLQGRKRCRSGSAGKIGSARKSGCIVRLEHALRLLFHCQKPVHLPFPRLWRSVPRLSCFVLHVKSRSVEIEPCVLTAGFGIQAALFQLYYAMHHLVSIEARLHASVCIDPVSEI